MEPITNLQMRQKWCLYIGITVIAIIMYLLGMQASLYAQVINAIKLKSHASTFFSRVHATLQPTLSVCRPVRRSVGRSVGRSRLAFLLPLPTRTRLRLVYTALFMQRLP